MVHYLCLSFFLLLSSNNPTQNEKKQMFLCFVGRATNLFLSFSSLTKGNRNSRFETN
jgi:hypothetical protein